MLKDTIIKLEKLKRSIKSLDFGLPSSVFGFNTSVFRLPSSNSKQQTPDFGLPSSSPKLRITAIFLILTILLPTITPYGNVLANNNGPNAPEAASFEPVDATDMVNLLTGDFTYVLPLMNVPSPEGGYPIALAYHAGIAMDQEASWVGLGWNLNPGAINRSVNGYPDDYDHALLSEYFYDEGQSSSQSHFSFSFTSLKGTSVGIGLSWGSNKSLGGHVSVGFGIPLPNDGKLGVSTRIGTNGASLDVGYKSSSGLSLGVSASSDGTIGADIGFSKNGVGMNVGAAIDGTYSVAFTTGDDNGNKASLGFDISSKGISSSLSLGYANSSASKNSKLFRGVGIRIGSNTFFSETIDQGKYTVNQSGFTIPLVLPTKIGVFSISFGRQTIDYWAASKTNSFVHGTSKFNGFSWSQKYIVRCKRAYYIPHKMTGYETFFNEIFYSKQDAQDASSENTGIHCYEKTWVNQTICSTCEIEKGDQSFMDTYEIPLQDGVDFGSNFNINNNNPVFPAYDKFNVQAQGLSGSIHAKLTDNGSLIGSTRSFANIEIEYEFDGISKQLPNHLKFLNKPQFYFDNEISTFLGVDQANFIDPSTALSKSSIKDVYQSNSVNNQSINHLKRSNHIEYYTNVEIESLEAKNKGLLAPVALGFDRDLMPEASIGAYKITAPDGKTYHYSLPVYNYATVTRQWGMTNSWKGFDAYKAYHEKRQLTPYATHWLLTAVTGPDFVDNGDGIASEGDLGYWVNFEYGLWDEAYVWKTPYGKPYHVPEDDPHVKTWVKGVKQQYFLNKIKTRTHTALFIKNEREDDRSPYWDYRSVDHTHGQHQDGGWYVHRFTIPEHKTMKLDEILLVKNEHDISNLSSGSTEGTVNIVFPQSGVASRTASYGIRSNVFDWTDNWQEVKNNAIKVIDLSYENWDKALVKGTPNAGDTNKARLTLGNVRFRGKKGADVMPPYRFDYRDYYHNTPDYVYNDKNVNEYGYRYDDPAAWSLEEITTPQGGEIKVNYESHDFKSLNSHNVKSHRKHKDAGKRDALGYVVIETKNILNLTVGNTVDLKFARSWGLVRKENESSGAKSTRAVFDYNHDTFDGEGQIKQIVKISDEKDLYNVKIDPIGAVNTQLKTNRIGLSWMPSDNLTNEKRIEEYENSYDEGNFIEIDFGTGGNNDNIFYGQGGSRVASITTNDGVNDVHSSRYIYGENGNGIGYVSYIPFAPEVDKEAPYSFELPAPIPMYEYVKHESLGSDGVVNGSTLYKFKVMKEKSSSTINYDDLYKIKINEKDPAWDGTKRRYVTVNEYTVEDNLNCLGQLLSVSNFNKEGQLLNKIENTYFKPGEIPDNMGHTRESYQSYKIASYSAPDHKTHWYVNSSTRVKYPNLLKSSTEYKNGVSYTSEFKNFDPISGQAKETYSFSSNGLEVKSASEPAFRIYPEMGSKADNTANKNMLSQGASTYSYFRTDPTDNWKLFDAEVQTWQDWGDNIWRKQKNYVWKGDLNDDGSFDFNPSQDDFVWNNHTTSESRGWEKVSEITRYSDWSRALETEDINGNRASNLMCDNYSKVLAVCNAPYNKMLNMNFDNSANLPHSVSLNGSHSTAVSYSTIHAHSGAKSLRIEPNASLGINLSEPDSYKISMWVHTSNFNNISVLKDNSPIQYNSKEVVYAGDWIQLNYYTSTSSAVNLNITSAGSGGVNDADLLYIDDLRIYPIESSMISYVYNEWDELISILGANNMGTKFEYDAAGRLIKTFTEVQNVDINGSTIGGFVPATETRQFYKNQ